MRDRTYDFGHLPPVQNEARFSYEPRGQPSKASPPPRRAEGDCDGTDRTVRTLHTCHAAHQSPGAHKRRENRSATITLWASRTIRTCTDRTHVKTHDRQVMPGEGAGPPARDTRQHCTYTYAQHLHTHGVEPAESRLRSHRLKSHSPPRRTRHALGQQWEHKPCSPAGTKQQAGRRLRPKHREERLKRSVEPREGPFRSRRHHPTEALLHGW